MERILGIDYGDSKVGVAVNDELNITAIPITTIMYKGDKEKLFNELETYIKQYNISKIVVGLPLNMNGTEGPRVEITKKFIDELINKFNLKVDTIDERLSTSFSNRMMNYTNVKKGKKKQIEDTMAAIYILQTYMERYS